MHKNWVRRGGALLTAGVLVTALAACSGGGDPGASSTEFTEPAVAEVTAGQLFGYLNEGVYTFRGVKYAEVDRFERAKPVEPWDGVKPALTYGPTCQNGANDNIPLTEFINFTGANLAQNEDCLYANIWTPTLDEDAKKPILFWIHGGGYASGSSNELSFYEGHNLAATGETVFISVNHRLNALGYLDLSDFGDQYADSGNLGQLDLVDALNWVRDNAAAFGGDPDNITIIGQSGGGGKVLTLLGMPEATPLISKAYAMSAATMWRTAEQAKAQTSDVMEALGVSTVEQLKEVPYLELFNTAAAAGIGWGPVIGTPAFPEATYTEDGGFTALAKDIPLVQTTVQGEFASNLGAMSYGIFGEVSDPTADAYAPNLTDEDVERLLKQRFGEQADAVRSGFVLSYPEQPVAHALWIEDGVFFGGTRVQVLNLKAQQGGAEVFGAVFAKTLPVFGGVTPPHTGGDIPFLFRNADKMTHIVAGSEDEFQKYAEEASDTLLAFAKTGNPSTDTIKWPVFSQEKAEMLVFDTKSYVSEQHEVELYKAFAAARGQ